MPVAVKKTVLTTITQEHELELTNEELIVILQNAGYEVGQHSKVFVTVPGGGDWSNMDLAISGRTPLRLTWKTVQEKKSDG